MFKRLAAGLMAIFLTGPWASPALCQDRVRVKIAHPKWIGYGPLYIAHEKGFFREYGLAVDLLVIEDESRSARALASGKIDGLGNFLDREVIRLADRPAEMMVLAFCESSGGDGIVAAKGIKRLRDLKGKTVGLDKSAASYFFFLTALERVGLSEDSVTVREMSAADASAAFLAGRLDAAVTWEPWLAKAVQGPGSCLLVSSKDFPKTIVDVLVLRREFATGHTQAMIGLVKAWFEAVDWMGAHPEKGYEIMARAMELETKFAKQMAAGVSFIGKKENRLFFRTKKGRNIYKVAASAARFWRKKGLIKSQLDVRTLIDRQYVLDAAR